MNLLSEHLKNRIIAPTGHLSNDQAGVFLSENYIEKLKYIFLCHLSKENNHPEIGYSTIKSHLDKKQIKVGEHLELVVLDRFTASELYVF